MSSFDQRDIVLIPKMCKRCKVKRHRLFSPLLFLPILILLLDGCLSQDMEYVRRDINTLQGQIDAIQKEITSIRTSAPPQPADFMEAQKGQADVEAELQNVKRDLNSLRASIEDNQHLTTKTSGRLDDLENRFTTKLNDLEAKLDQLLAKAEEVKEIPSQPVSATREVEAPSPAEVKGPATPEAPPSRVSSDVERAYHEAYEAFQAGNLDGAKKMFLSFLKKYPDTPLSDNAQFWIGEISFKKHHYEGAILAYENVIKKYPDSNKLPDAILKQGLAFLELGDKIDARIILQNLVKKYPDTEQAKIAKNKLKALK